MDLKELSKFYGITIEDLKDMSYRKLEVMTDDMKKKKEFIKFENTKHDIEYKETVKTYFAPFNYLSNWFSEDEIIEACAKTYPNINDFVEEFCVKHGEKKLPKNAEYLRTEYRVLPRYTRSGERLMEGSFENCDVYRVVKQYQGLIDGKIVLKLLYAKYPQLKEFEFNAYEIHDNIDYIIYPKNNLFTPFEALMNKDVDAIIEKNIEYATSYNKGNYTIIKVNERINSEKVRHFFEVIKNL